MVLENWMGNNLKHDVFKYINNQLVNHVKTLLSIFHLNDILKRMDKISHLHCMQLS